MRESRSAVITVIPGVKVYGYLIGAVTMLLMLAVRTPVIALTAPEVPTGMKVGVWMTPCEVVRMPRRAEPSIVIMPCSARRILLW